MASRGWDGSRGRGTDARDWVGRLLSHSVDHERTVKIRYHKHVYIAKSEVEMKTEGEGYTTAEKERAIIRLGRVRHFGDQSLKFCVTVQPLSFMCNVELTVVFLNHTCAGIVDGSRTLAAIQHSRTLARRPRYNRVPPSQSKLRH